MILIFVMSDDVITLVTGLHSCLVTGLHSWVTVSTYWVSHTVLCSVQQLGEDTGAGAGTDTDMSYIYKTGPFLVGRQILSSSGSSQTFNSNLRTDHDIRFVFG